MPTQDKTPADPAQTDGTERFYRRLFDISLFAFSGLCAVFILLAEQDRDMIPLRLVVCALPLLLTAVLVQLLKRFPTNPLLWLLRYTTPLWFLTFFFRLTGQIFPVFPMGAFDPLMMRLDGLLFGDPQVAVHFQEQAWAANPLFGEFMCGSYILYYILVPWFGVLLVCKDLWRRRGPSPIFAWYATVVSVTYYLHYAVFFLLPVAGPAFYTGTGVLQDPGFLLARVRYHISSGFDVSGGGFPSSHVSVALLHVFVALRFRWWKTLAGVSIITVGICFATVWTRAHYAVDSVGGLFSAVLCWMLFKAIHGWAAGRR